jgi:hypothetical protein
VQAEADELPAKPMAAAPIGLQARTNLNKWQRYGQAATGMLKATELVAMQMQLQPSRSTAALKEKTDAASSST